MEEDEQEERLSQFEDDLLNTGKHDATGLVLVHLKSSATTRQGFVVGYLFNARVKRTDIDKTYDATNLTPKAAIRGAVARFLEDVEKPTT